MIFDDAKSQFQIKEFDENILSESAFERSLSLHLEFDESVRIATLEFYNTLQEAKVSYQEAASRFKAVIRQSMRAYLDKSRLEVDYFARAFEKRIENDKEIINPHLSSLKKNLQSKPSAEVLFNSDEVRYNYTFIMEDKIPNVNYMDTFIEKNIDLQAISAYKGLSDYQKLEMIEKDYNTLVEYIKSGECYSNARGNILCKKSPISAEDFDTELFKIYRDGGKEIYTPITANDILKAIDRFDKYSKAIKNIQDDYDIYSSRRMKVVMDQLNRLDMINAKEYFGNSKNSFDKWYSMYIALKNEQLMRLTAIHHHCISAKLDALIKSYLQDRDILIKAIGITKAEDEFVAESFEIYDYSGYLIEEKFNALSTFIEAMDITRINLDESQIEMLQEGVMDNLKNFLSNMATRISEVINKFSDRANELFDGSKKFIETNQKKLLSGQVFDNATIDNYYPYDDLTQRLGNLNFKLANVAEVEQNALEDKWQTDADYIKSSVSIAGFVYKENEGSLKEQLVTFFRGQKQQINSKAINKEFLTEGIKYCTTDFPAIKKTLDNDKEVLKTFAKSMDTYIAGKMNNSNATVTATTTQAQTVATGTGQTQSTNDAFSYQDTLDMYFHEVDIKDNNPGNSGVKQSVEGAKKKGDDLKKIATAFKSYIKVNSQLVSTKMKLAVELRKQYMKLMQWYVKEYNSQNKEEKETKNDTQKNTNNKSISDAIR